MPVNCLGKCDVPEVSWFVAEYSFRGQAKLAALGYPIVYRRPAGSLDLGLTKAAAGNLPMN